MITNAELLLYMLLGAHFTFPFQSVAWFQDTNLVRQDYLGLPFVRCRYWNRMSSYCTRMLHHQIESQLSQDQMGGP